MPESYGDVSSGEYDKPNDAVAFWERDRADRDHFWETVLEADLTTDTFCFQHLIGTTANVAFTSLLIEGGGGQQHPRDKLLDQSRRVYDALRVEFSHFPLHTYWKLGKNEESSAWILDAASEAIERPIWSGLRKR